MSYSIIGKYRAPLMGVAMLMIIIYHMSITSSGIFNIIKNMGDIGVCLFLFLSGYSMYFAWIKRPETTWFLKRRVSRVLISFLPVVIAWCLPQFLIGRIPLTEFLAKITTMLYWINGNLLYWFISGIIALYLLTPFWIKLYSKYPKPVLVITGAICILLIILARTKYLIHICGFIDRMPLYFAGIIISEASKRQIKITWKGVTFIIGLVVSGITILAVNDWNIWGFHYKYIVQLLWTFPIIMFFIIIFEKLSLRYLLKMLTFCGGITLETYLFQERILYITGIIFNRFSIKLDSYNIILNLLVVVITVIGAYMYKQIIDKAYIKIFSS